MLEKLASALDWLVHGCSEFGFYLMSLQSSHCTTQLSRRCEGGPNFEEARRDYQEMLRARLSPYVGFS